MGINRHTLERKLINNNRCSAKDFQTCSKDDELNWWESCSWNIFKIAEIVISRDRATVDIRDCMEFSMFQVFCKCNASSMMNIKKCWSMWYQQTLYIRYVMKDIKMDLSALHCQVDKQQTSRKESKATNIAKVGWEDYDILIVGIAWYNIDHLS